MNEPIGRIVLVHGFTQTSAAWAEFAAVARAAGHEVESIDVPGHGRSGDLQLGFADAAHWLADTGGSATYVGYSLGARLCLRAALDRAEVERLVLVSGTAGIVDRAERAQRLAADQSLAERIMREGVDAFLERWLSQPLFATLPRERAGLETRRANTPAGLASAVERFSPGSQEPLWDRLEDLAIPVLCVAGALDHKYVALARQLVERIGPGASSEIVEGAGHAVHLEQPDSFADIVMRWLSST